MGVFFKKKKVYFPTIWGGLLLIFLVFLSFYLLVRNAYSFLAVSVAPGSKTLVVEGWVPESGLRNALHFYQENQYKNMIMTGVPITQWTYSSPFSNMADASAGSMKRMFFNDTIYRAIIPSTVLRDRTYSTAVALKMLLPQWNIKADSFDLYTMGPHARRTYLMFSKAFPNSKIGLITDTDPSFDTQKWYTTSAGFRLVFSEWVSYIYSFFFFHPNEETTRNLIRHGHYLDSITNQRFKKDNEFADTLTSPLGRNEMSAFRGLKYFSVDTIWKKRVEIAIDTSEPSFFMPTTTERKPLYRKYATLSFMHNGIVYSLTAFQNLDHKKKNPSYNALFVPFKDSTSAHETYGGGRFLDFEIPTSKTAILDFNTAYNPYCAYHERWSCPLPPPENYLKLAVKAGEKNYKNHDDQ